MIAARQDTITQIPTKQAWSEIATEDTWVGALPVQMHRQAQDIYLRDFPFLIGFTEGRPRVILNKILVQKSANLNRVYVNEWARPWVIAEILDATGFTTDDLIVATMKAKPLGTASRGLRI